MEYVAAPTAREGVILCCQCGNPIPPNPSNMCVACIRTRVDITEGIPNEAIIYLCKGCGRYLNPPNHWVYCAVESRELLALCLKKLKGLDRVRLVDAAFEWCEPHSRRIKVKMTIQKEVMNGAILEQKYLVVFKVHTQMCDACHRSEAKDYWSALVQLRQKVEHKKTFYYLEQLILRHRAHMSAIGIKPKHDGLDFLYGQKQDARKMVDFLLSVVPCRYQTAQQLISHDTHSNTYNYKNTFSVEIVPICKDNIVCLPEKLARSLGGINQLCICTQIAEQIHLIDPITTQIADISSQVFWREPFASICGPKQLQLYVVMNVEFSQDGHKQKFPGQGALSDKHRLADVWVVRSNELGLNYDQQHCRTHLGYLLQPGTTVLGFDLANANVNDIHFEKMKAKNIPDVILVKKYYADKAVRNRRRKWKLKHLYTEATGDDMDRDYTDFLEDLEENQSCRQNINIFVDQDKIAAESNEMDDDNDEIPEIALEEMMNDLYIQDEATAEEKPTGE